jgi:hypothetical protein
MSEFLNNDEPASSMVVGMGYVIKTMYNLKGELVSATHDATRLVFQLPLLTSISAFVRRSVLETGMVQQAPVLCTAMLTLTETTSSLTL